MLLLALSLELFSLLSCTWILSMLVVHFIVIGYPILASHVYIAYLSACLSDVRHASTTMKCLHGNTYVMLHISTTSLQGCFSIHWSLHFSTRLLELNHDTIMPTCSDIGQASTARPNQYLTRCVTNCVGLGIPYLSFCPLCRLACNNALQGCLPCPASAYPWHWWKDHHYGCAEYNNYSAYKGENWAHTLHCQRWSSARLQWEDTGGPTDSGRLSPATTLNHTSSAIP